jgi:hypothetical protein
MDDACSAEAFVEYVEDAPPMPIATFCSARASGERAMLHAMLLDAIQCLEGQGCPKRDRQRLAREARSWVARRDAAPFSFENVCAYLGLPVERVRRHLLDLAARSVPGDEAFGVRRRASSAEIRARAERNLSIRSLRAGGASPGELADRFGLSYAAILSICAPRTSARSGPLTAPLTAA